MNETREKLNPLILPTGLHRVRKLIAESLEIHSKLHKMSNRLALTIEAEAERVGQLTACKKFGIGRRTFARMRKGQRITRKQLLKMQQRIG